MNGYNGNILRVDLTNHTFKVDTPPDQYFKQYLGGRGFIIHTLLSELPASADPLGPENKLVFAPGLATGHSLMGSGRNSIGAKSPLSGGYGESEAGGFWGAELRRAGYDAIIVEGESPEPVYLWIDRGRVEIRDAAQYWGMEIATVDRALKQSHADKRIRVAAIGPGGENRVRYATIANDIKHIAGRTGLGAVMGAKRLKAIAVKGTTPPETAYPDKLKVLASWMVTNFKEISSFWKVGTGEGMKRWERSGNLPVKNFSGGNFAGVNNITPQTMFDKSFVKTMKGCFKCPMRCKRIAQVHTVPEVDAAYGGPEYETLAALGSNLLIDDLEVLIRGSEICNRYGIDSISAGVSISFAMECYENGLLTPEDTDGLDLKFGNSEAMLRLLEMIALRKGLGDLLAEGTKKAASVIGKGAEKFAMHVKGEEIPMHEPRVKQGMALHFSVHSTGADHNTGIHDDVLSKNVGVWSRFGVETLPADDLSSDKALMLYKVGLWRQLVNHLGLCLFVPWKPQQLVEIIEAITGWSMSDYELMKSVERGITLSRIFNLREGFDQQDDQIPERFYNYARKGPLKDTRIDKRAFSSAQEVYYQLLGWNEAGIPSYGRLVELSIPWASEYLP